jgi:hypothetical protein
MGLSGDGGGKHMKTLRRWREDMKGRSTRELMRKWQRSHFNQWSKIVVSKNDTAQWLLWFKLGWRRLIIIISSSSSSSSSRSNSSSTSSRNINVFYRCEIRWTRLRMSETKERRRIFGPKKNWQAGSVGPILRTLRPRGGVPSSRKPRVRLSQNTKSCASVYKTTCT